MITVMAGLCGAIEADRVIHQTADACHVFSVCRPGSGVKPRASWGALPELEPGLQASEAVTLRDVLGDLFAFSTFAYTKGMQCTITQS